MKQMQEAIAAAGYGKGKEDMKNEDTKQDHKISDYINKMDDELKDRFKAIKTLTVDLHESEDAHAKDYRKLELEYEKKYKTIYDIRDKFINTKDGALTAEEIKKYVAEFDEVHKKMKDADYEKVEVVQCDVKPIQNSPNGISDFWQRALLNHPIGEMVQEKDRPILGYLENIELELHEGEDQKGYDLKFTFTKNSYFKGTEIKKSIFQTHENYGDKIECTPITWNDGSNPTIKKQKKKKKGKKVTVETKIDSFFNIFKTIDLAAKKDDEKDKNKEKKDDDDEGEGEDDDEQNELDEALEIADQIKDDLVPLALEYYLGVIELEDLGDDDDESDDDDEDDGKKKKKKGGKGGGGKEGLGGKEKDCKQQ